MGFTVGQRVADWIVLADAGKSKDRRQTWKCQCALCGKEKLVTERYITSGKSTSCGCNRGRLNLIGQRFGKLVVVAPSRVNEDRAGWLCKCDCGTEVTLRTDSLTNKTSTHCGCNRLVRHGDKLEKQWGKLDRIIIQTYYHMIHRCHDKTHPAYHNYGARGISVCPEWRENRAEFMDWAHKNGARIGLELDRINNDGNYEPSNCRYVTPQENNQNKRTNKIRVGMIENILTLRKEGTPLRVLASMYGVRESCISRICNGTRWANITGIKPDATPPSTLP